MVKVLVFALLGMAMVGGALAEEAAIQASHNLDLSRRAGGGALAALIAAQDLFALSTARLDPLAALAAARIMAGIGLSPVSRQPAEGQIADQLGDGALSGLIVADRMFNVARGMALDDGLAALVEAERIGHSGPPTQTVQITAGLVAGGAQDRWDLAFYAGELAEVAVLGDFGGVLDIRVEDAGGQLICRQAGPRDQLYCPFVPRENGRFSVFVANPGVAPRGYGLLTN